MLRPAEMVAFGECRRSWDWGAQVRSNLVPRVPLAPFDFDVAVRAGLAAYYLPAMDDWSRSIVRPLALKGFRRAMLESRAAYAAACGLDEDAMQAWERFDRLGTVVLHRYFAFAAAFDDFDSVLADEDLWVPVPDPRDPGRDLGTADGRPVRYLCRLDQLISDDDDEWWVVRHRVARDGWATDEELLDDGDGVRLVWAVEIAYTQLYVAGTVYNELLVTAQDEEDPAGVDEAALDVPPDGAELDRRDMRTGTRHLNLRRDVLTPEERILGTATDERDHVVHRETDGHVRRTWVRRGHGQIHAVGMGISDECIEMVRADVAVPPSPSATTCARCAFLRPCLVLERGGDPSELLGELYRPRRDEEFDEAALRRSAQRDRARAALGGVTARQEGRGTG